MPIGIDEDQVMTSSPNVYRVCICNSWKVVPSMNGVFPLRERPFRLKLMSHSWFESIIQSLYNWKLQCYSLIKLWNVDLSEFTCIHTMKASSFKTLHIWSVVSLFTSCKVYLNIPNGARVYLIESIMKRQIIKWRQDVSLKAYPCSSTPTLLQLEPLNFEQSQA